MFQVHAGVQHADDLNGAGGYLSVENDMAAGAVFAIARPDVAAIPAFQRTVRQVLKTPVQHRQIGIALRPTLGVLGMTTDSP